MQHSTTAPGGNGKPGGGGPARLNPLEPPHLADLGRSGLGPEQVEACGFYTETSARRLGDLLRWDGPAAALGHCLVLPFRGPDGAPTGYARVKPDRPRVDARGKPVKYESPRGLPNRAYFP